MKAHEENWDAIIPDYGQGYAVIRGTEAIAVHAGSQHRLALAAAAPDMARRLMGILRGFNQGYRLTPAEAQGIEADLRKAGVI